MSAEAPMKIFLAGEGPNEIGNRAAHAAYRTEARPGVLEVLLRRVQPEGWEVGAARVWTSIRKYRVGKASHNDTHNVLGIALDAIEAGCDILAFSRDLDNDPDRKAAIEDGLARIPVVFPRPPEVIGGVAVPALEGWILALLGRRKTEELTTPQAVKALTEESIDEKDGLAMVTVAEEADIDLVPEDAASLRAWLERAREVLPPAVKDRTSR